MRYGLQNAGGKLEPIYNVRTRIRMYVDRQNHRNVVVTSRAIHSGLKFVRSNQYYSEDMYMRENVGKQYTHVHCNMAIGEGGSACKEGVTRGNRRLVKRGQIGGGRAKGGRREWRGMELEVEQKGLKGAARFIQRGLQPAGVKWGKERGGQPDKQNPCCFISARLARHRPFIRARFRPTLGSFIPFLLDQSPEPLNASSSCTFSTLLFEFVN